MPELQGATASRGSSQARSAASAPCSRIRGFRRGNSRDGDVPLPESERLFFFFASVALVILAGLMSGLTLGLMSLDVVDLQVILRSGSEREKSYARKIAPVSFSLALHLAVVVVDPRPRPPSSAFSPSLFLSKTHPATPRNRSSSTRTTSLSPSSSATPSPPRPSPSSSTG